MTTPEQTALDFAKRPELGSQPEAANEALWTLARAMEAEGAGRPPVRHVEPERFTGLPFLAEVEETR